MKNRLLDMVAVTTGLHWGTVEKSSSLIVALRGSLRPRLAEGVKGEGCSLTRWRA